MRKLRSGWNVYSRFQSTCDGTLRFLVLSVLNIDPDVRGILCLEEPENGIHPERVPVMIDLLRAIAVDPSYEVNNDNPLRQVVVNTHAPLVVGNTEQDELIYMGSIQITERTRRGMVAQPLVPPDSWRGRKTPGAGHIAPGNLAGYFRPSQSVDA